MRSAAIFAIFGFIAALVQAFGQEWTLEQTLLSGLGWAVGFGLLGWGIGRAARTIAREALHGEKCPAGESAIPDEYETVGRAWVRPRDESRGRPRRPPAERGAATVATTQCGTDAAQSE